VRLRQKTKIGSVTVRKIALCACIALLLLFSLNTVAECATYQADDMPWSGYWWPQIQGGLVTGNDYRGHPAPLEKYDYAVTGSYDGPATTFGWENHYDPQALSWAGLCFCWAAASVLEPEPVHNSVYNGTVFRVGDKKGLLTAAYLGTLYNAYPIEGPADFHRLLEDFIAAQKTPIIMDLGFDGQSWNYPIFKYESNYVQEGNVRHYTTVIYYVGDEVDPDTTSAHILTNTYFYYFISDAEGNITESGWEKGSGKYPPINASEPFGTECQNPGLDYEKVKEIANSADDAFEENDDIENALFLTTGNYSVSAADSDYFKVVMKKRDRLNIRLKSDPQDHYSEPLEVYLRTYTPDRTLIKETAGAGEQEIVADDEGGTYFFEIAPQNPRNIKEPLCNLFIRQTLSFGGVFPILPKGLWQSGMSLLIPDRDSWIQSDRAVISLTDQSGFPIKSYTDISDSRHVVGMVEEGFGLFPFVGTEYIRVESDLPFWGLQLATDGDAVMLGSNFIPLERASSQIFFPHFYRSSGWFYDWQTEIGIINVGDKSEEIVLTSYDAEGLAADSLTITLKPGEKTESDASAIAILSSKTKTMSAAATSGRDCLIGYAVFLNPTPGGMGRDVVQVTGRRGQVAGNTLYDDSILIAPHVACNDDWWTKIAVMNTGEADSVVAFSAFNPDGKLAGVFKQMLRARQNFVKDVSEIFPDMLPEDIGNLKIVSENKQPLCGIMFYGDVADRQLAALPLRPIEASSLYLPLVACSDLWWTGVGIMNTGNTSADVSFSLFDSEGKFLSQVSRRLNANQRIAYLADDLFGDDFSESARYMKAESLGGQPLSGIYLIGTTDGLRLMGDEMLSAD
jgi:hypothetical protein